MGKKRINERRRRGWMKGKERIKERGRRGWMKGEGEN